MSANATITAPFGDGRHEFRLGIAQLEEHDRLCDAGPEFVMHAILNGSWRTPYIRETIRLGLVGGGTDPMTALVLTDAYAGPGQLMGLKSLAVNILGAALVGPAGETEGDPSGEPKGETDPSPEDD
ncbi:gene transfer agent family protein [uncultured Brevundimonas sp.]|uniref:gene transfer agent family protein n=1 Tax=uncultured Brevundimonas sp. TaxID=213418 RepID=UPI0026125070|nr:gene transfer agent family protein [uncultured Brevundimonas sp.]